jgi:hypothetical protein
LLLLLLLLLLLVEEEVVRSWRREPFQAGLGVGGVAKYRFCCAKAAPPVVTAQSEKAAFAGALGGSAATRPVAASKTLRRVTLDRGRPVEAAMRHRTCPPTTLSRPTVAGTPPTAMRVRSTAAGMGYTDPEALGVEEGGAEGVMGLAEALEDAWERVADRVEVGLLEGAGLVEPEAVSGEGEAWGEGVAVGQKEEL